MILSALAGCAHLGDDAAPHAKPLSPDAVQANLESLDVILQTLRDTNWDPDVAGMDVAALRAEYAPRIEAAETMRDVHAAYGALLRSFGQSHLNIIPRDLYDDMERDGGDETAPGAIGDGVTGIRLRLYRGAVYVTGVDADSPAAQAGVLPGWRIHAVDGEKLAPILKRMDETLGDSSMLPLLTERAIRSRLDGPMDARVRVEFRAGREKHSYTLTRRDAKGKPFSFGNLPAVDTWIEHRRLEDDIGYIAFNYFMDPMRLGPAFEAAVRELGDATGMIVDLRGNGGGIAGLAMGFAGWFVTEKNAYLGTMHFRDADMRFVLNPRVGAYTGPLAVLVDGCSASCSEIFAAGLRDLGRARIFGDVTAGAALPANFTRLPNGDGFMYPVADYVSKSGDRLEGVGVTPDVLAPPVPEALLTGADPALDAAVAWINEAITTRE